VVANEVRALAAKSADAAKDAADLIQKCTDQVQKGSKIVSQTNEILCGIEERSARLHGIMNQIDTSAAEQALAISQITQGLSQVSSVVQSNAQSAERESETSRTLLEQAGCLYQEMGRFRFSVPCEETKQGPKKLSAVQNAQKRPGQIAREPEIQESAVEQDIQEETQESAVEQDIQEETQESAVERDIQEETQESAVEQDVQEETQESAVERDIQEKTQESAVERDIQEEMQESTIEQDIQEEAQEKTGHGEDTAADLPE
jgi:methyl-accepting chemotaxis protein